MSRNIEALQFMGYQAIDLLHEIDAADTDKRRLECAMELIQLYQRMFDGAVKQIGRALEQADQAMDLTREAHKCVEDVTLFYLEPEGTA